MKRCIDNIIFDLGGVLYDIEYEKTFEELGSLLNMDLSINNWPPNFKKIVHAYETGSIKTETFLWSLQRMSKRQIPDPKKLINAWNAMLIGWHYGVLDMLKELKKDHKLFLISNINDLHYQCFIRSFKSSDRFDDFNNLFVGTCYSNVVGLKKPDIQIFEYLLNEYEVDASKTLFVDDSDTNVRSAKKAGINAVCHNGRNSIVKEIFFYLELVC